MQRLANQGVIIDQKDFHQPQSPSGLHARYCIPAGDASCLRRAIRRR
jgi:hypothetical protein